MQIFDRRGNPKKLRGSILQADDELRVSAGARVGLGGANYGGSGQVLTSAGSGSNPTWQTPSGGGGGGGDPAYPFALGHASW